MNRSSKSKVLGMKGLNLIYRSIARHHLVDKMLYIQTQVREGDDAEYYLYPCYLMDVVADEKKERIEEFVLDIIQYTKFDETEHGIHQVARIKVPVKSMGKTWQIWMDAPSSKLIGEHPLDSKPLPARVLKEENADGSDGEENCGHSGEDRKGTGAEQEGTETDRGRAGEDR